jgi:hypothetical protein
MSTDAPAVRSLQQWMLRVVTHHDGLDSGLLEASQEEPGNPGGSLDVEDIVPPNARLSSQEQLQIYAFMYFARLIEVMEDEYPNVLFLLGPDRFARVARAYLGEHPSSHYNLGRLSAGFPDYLATLDESAAYPAFASALARVERAMEDIVDDPAEEPIAFETLTAIPLDNWPQARMRPIRALRLLQLDHPVNDFMNARREEYFAPVPEPGEVAMCIHRVGFQVYRHEIEPEQFLLLSSLNDGATLGEAIESVALSPGCDADKMMAGLSGWFEEWMADDLFASIELD